MIAPKQKEKKHRKAGRPSGSKSSSGIPRTSIINAIELIKKVYNQYKNNFISHEELRTSLGIAKGNDTLVTGELSKYGFLEKTNYGWHVTELGKNAIDNNKDAIVEAFQKNVVLSELYHKFFDKNVSSGSIVSYLKNKYRKGENNENIASKFLEAKDFIQHLENTNTDMKGLSQEKDTALLLYQLKYALEPPENRVIELLSEQVAEKLNATKDETLKLLAELILEKKHEKNELLNLVNKVMKKMSLENIELDNKTKHEKFIERQKELKKKHQSDTNEDINETKD